MSIIFAFLALIPFYLLGAFPTGQLVARFHRIDLTAAGSGNIGATNAARVLGKKAGVAVLGGDVLKGALACAIAGLVFANPAMQGWAGFAAVAGHCFSIPGKLKGGKGVATGLGTFLYLSFASALFAIAVFALFFC